MSGIDPYEYMRFLATKIDQLQDRAELETALDEMEYLFEVIPPEMQEPAEQLIRLLRQKLNLD